MEGGAVKRPAFDVGTKPERLCACGIPALSRTSNTAANPGRMFYKCAMLGGGCMLVLGQSLCMRAVRDTMC